MTVFGFGRAKLVQSLQKTPAHFTVALLDAADETALREQISRMCNQ